MNRETALDLIASMNITINHLRKEIWELKEKHIICNYDIVRRKKQLYTFTYCDKETYKKCL